MGELAPLYPVSREHFNTLSDETGIMQHAIGRRPDPAHGYCTDDVARGLLVDLVHLPELGWQAVDVSVRRSLRFLVDAFDPALGRFRNCRGSDGRWLDSTRSQDAHARAILALGELIARAPQGTPTARRTPISLMRSRIDASMMFMIPIPPTSKLIPATNTSSTVKRL